MYLFVVFVCSLLFIDTLMFSAFADLHERKKGKCTLLSMSLSSLTLMFEELCVPDRLSSGVHASATNRSYDPTLADIEIPDRLSSGVHASAANRSSTLPISAFALASNSYSALAFPSPARVTCER